MTNNIGKALITLGLGITIIGLGFLLFSRLKLPFLGKLPGDILIQKKNFTFYFPLATSLILSAVLSFILYIVSKIHK
ncbi:MAG: DUF2905 domain-containing protein [Candidatus Omnitrophota bacterium]